MASTPEDSAQEYIAEAKKVLDSWRLFNKSGKYEEASELYSKAAAQYKIAKAWQEAGEAYIKAGELSQQAGNTHDAINHYTNAAKCFKTGGNKQDAIRMYEMVVERQQENNKFSVAAKLYKEIAELEEADLRLGNAIEAYQKAADCFRADDAKTSANQCLIKVADLCASQAEYKRAIDLYEQVAQESLDNNLTKWSATEYHFKAALCCLAMSAKLGNDNGGMVRTAIDGYKDMNPQFEGSRECQFLEKLLPPYEERNSEDFTDVVADFDAMYKLDKWKSSLLLIAKQSLMADREPDLS